jgi:hypothetical protein
MASKIGAEEAVPAFVLYPAKLVECAMERPFQTCLLSG